MIVGFSQQIPYKWNNILTCAIGAILLLATCSLIGIILLICLGVSQHQQQHHQQQQLYHMQNQQQQQQVYRKDSNMVCGGVGAGTGAASVNNNNNNYYGTPCSRSATPPSTLNYSTSSSLFLGLSQQSLVVGLKCTIAFSWIIPTLYCIILWLIRHVMRTHSATWWLKFTTVECNLLIVNQTLLGVIFYLVFGVLVKRMLVLLPKAQRDQKLAFVTGTAATTTSSGGGQRYVDCQLIVRGERYDSRKVFCWCISNFVIVVVVVAYSANNKVRAIAVT